MDLSFLLDAESIKTTGILVAAVIAMIICRKDLAE
jgi:hypothetical protein